MNAMAGRHSAARAQGARTGWRTSNRVRACSTGPSATSVGASASITRDPKLRTASTSTASSLAVISASGITRPKASSCPAICSARAAGRSSPISRPDLQLRLGAGHFLGTGRLGDRRHFAGDNGRQLGGLGLAGAGIDADHAAIGEGMREGVDRIAQPALLTHFLEQPRGHAAAQRGRIDLGRIDVRIGAGDPGKSVGDMHLFVIFSEPQIAAAIARRLRRRAGSARQRCESVLGQSRRSHHDPPRPRRPASSRRRDSSRPYSAACRRA